MKTLKLLIEEYFENRVGEDEYSLCTYWDEYLNAEADLLYDIKHDGVQYVFEDWFPEQELTPAWESFAVKAITNYVKNIMEPRYRESSTIEQHKRCRQ